MQVQVWEAGQHLPMRFFEFSAIQPDFGLARCRVQFPPPLSLRALTFALNKTIAAGILTWEVYVIIPIRQIFFELTDLRPRFLAWKTLFPL